MGCLIRHYHFLFVLVISAISIQAQNLDSLKQALSTAKHDTTRCIILNAMVEAESDDNVWPAYNEQLLRLSEKNKETAGSKALKFFYNKQLASALYNVGFLAKQQDNISKALEYYQKSFKIQEGMQDKKGMGNALISIGVVYDDIGNPVKALDFYKRSLMVREEIQDKTGITSSLNNIGNLYKNLGDIQKALEYHHKALKIREEILDSIGIANSLNNIASIYDTQGDSLKTLEYYLKSLKIYELMRQKKGMATALSNIAGCYITKGNYVKALDHINRSMVIFEQIHDKRGMATALINIGEIYKKQDNLTTALEYFQKSLTLREEIQDKKGITHALNGIAMVRLTQGQLGLADDIASRALQTAKEIGFPENIGRSAAILKNIYQKQNKYKAAFEMYELEIKMRDSINNQETQKASVKKQMQYTYEKKELLMKAEQDKKDVIAKEELKQKEKERNYFVGGFGIVMILALFIFRSYRQKQKDNTIITQQKHIVEEKQKEILDSILYAKRIQTALMTNEKYIEKSLNKLHKNL